MTNTNYPSANQPQNRPTGNNNAKNIAIGLLAAGLLGTWGYFLYDKNKSDEKIQITQTQAAEAMSGKDSVQILYNESLARLDSITGSNNNMQGELSDNQSEIAKLRKEISGILAKRNATQAELSRAKSLIATLNDKIGNLEAEVARL